MDELWGRNDGIVQIQDIYCAVQPKRVQWGRSVIPTYPVTRFILHVRELFMAVSPISTLTRTYYESPRISGLPCLLARISTRLLLTQVLAMYRDLITGNVPSPRLKAGLRRMSFHVVQATIKLRNPIIDANKPNMRLIVLSVDSSRGIRPGHEAGNGKLV